MALAMVEPSGFLGYPPKLLYPSLSFLPNQVPPVKAQEPTSKLLCETRELSRRQGTCQSQLGLDLLE